MDRPGADEQVDQGLGVAWGQMAEIGLDQSTLNPPK